MIIFGFSLTAVAAFIAGGFVVAGADELMELRLERSHGSAEQRDIRVACVRSKTVGLHLVQGASAIAMSAIAFTAH